MDCSAQVATLSFKGMRTLYANRDAFVEMNPMQQLMAKAKQTTIMFDGIDDDCRPLLADLAIPEITAFQGQVKQSFKESNRLLDLMVLSCLTCILVFAGVIGGIAVVMRVMTKKASTEQCAKWDAKQWPFRRILATDGIWAVFSQFVRAKFAGENIQWHDDFVLSMAAANGVTVAEFLFLTKKHIDNSAPIPVNIAFKLRENITNEAKAMSPFTASVLLNSAQLDMLHSVEREVKKLLRTNFWKTFLRSEAFQGYMDTQHMQHDDARHLARQFSQWHDV